MGSRMMALRVIYFACYRVVNQRRNDRTHKGEPGGYKGHVRCEVAPENWTDS